MSDMYGDPDVTESLLNEAQADLRAMAEIVDDLRAAITDVLTRRMPTRSRHRLERAMRRGEDRLFAILEGTDDE